jgi:hypothetical protein
MKSNNSRRYYVYAYLRSVNSANGAKYSPYYIGKGSGSRILSNQGRPVNKPRNKSLIVYIQEGLTEQEAFALESYCIDLYGRLDLGTGCLRNKSNGGEGASGVIKSEATRQKISRAHKGKVITAETRKKISKAGKGRKLSLAIREKMSERQKGESNPFWGQKHSEQFKDRRSKDSAIYEYELTGPDGTIYTTHSLTLFAREHGLRQGCLSLVAHGKRNQHHGWKVCILRCLK